MRAKLAVFLVFLMLCTTLSGCTTGDGRKKLVVYIQNNEGMLNTIVDTYKIFYNKKVNLDLRILDNDEFADVLAADLMAGQGPDLIIADANVFDFEKYMHNNAFADFNALLEDYRGINLKRMNQSALKAGQANGKQLTMPISFHLPLVYTSEAKTRENSIYRSQLQGFEYFAKSLAKAIDQSNAPYDVFTDYNGTPGTVTLTDLLNLSGVQLYDWVNERNNVYSSEFQLVLETYKLLKNAEAGLAERIETDEDYANTLYGTFRRASLGTDMVFKNLTNGELTDILRNLMVNANGERAMLAAYTNIKGGVTGRVYYCAAISASARNKEGALDFLSYFYDDTYHINRETWLPGIPVANKFLTRQTAESVSYLNNNLSRFNNAGLSYQYNDNLANTLTTLVNNLSECKFPSIATDAKMEAALEAYCAGEQTLEECLKILHRRVEIYAKG